MTRLLCIIGLLLSLLGPLHCDGPDKLQESTPPFPGPGSTESPPPPNEGPSVPNADQQDQDKLDSNPKEIELSEENNQDPQDNPSSIISSTSGAFSTESDVTIGFFLPLLSNGAPDVGPLPGQPGGPIDKISSVEVLEDGSIAFGIYLTPTTQPGTYPVFAKQGGEILATDVIILPASHNE